MTRIRCIVFLTSLLLGGIKMAVSGNDTPNTPVQITSEIRYEYDSYSCLSQESSALLKVSMGGGGTLRRRLSVTSILDVSSSMDTDAKMQVMLEGNAVLLERLAASDISHQFGSVKFSATASEITPLAAVTQTSVEDFAKKTATFRAEGPTNLFEGLRMGFEQQTNDSISFPDGCEFIRAVFFFTDGEPTTGEIVNHDAIVAEVGKWNEQRPDIEIFTFLLGQKETFGLLERIAEMVGGASVRAENALRLNSGVEHAVSGLMTQMASRVVYTISPEGGARITNVASQHPVRRDGDNRILDLGKMREGETHDAVVSFLMASSCEETKHIEVEGKIHMTPCDAPAIDKTKITPPSRVSGVNIMERNADVQSRELLLSIELELEAITFACDLNERKSGCLNMIRSLIWFSKIFAAGVKKPWIQDVEAALQEVEVDLENSEKITISLISEIQSIHELVTDYRSKLPL